MSQERLLCEEGEKEGVTACYEGGWGAQSTHFSWRPDSTEQAKDDSSSETARSSWAWAAEKGWTGTHMGGGPKDGLGWLAESRPVCLLGV